MSSIRLNFVNLSKGVANSQVVIFMKNAASESSGTAVAWQVFSTRDGNGNHPFAFSFNFNISASDSFGKETIQQPAVPGNRFEMVSSAVGNQLQLSTQAASSPMVIEVYNELPVGTINALIYNNGNVLAETTGIGLGQKTTFVFEPSIFLLLTDNVNPGDFIDVPDLGSLTMLSLLGIASADIVMSGGGKGTTAQPVLFSLQNTTYA